MTGGAAFVGKEISEALHVVEDSVNKSGGVRGRPVKFVIGDDQTNPQVAVQLTSGIVGQNVPVFMGSAIAAMCNAQAALIKDGPLMYCFSPSINPTPGSYVFSGMYASDDLNAVSVRYLRERGLRKIALLNGTDASGQEAEKALIAIGHLAENNSVSFVSVERFNLSDISVAAQLARIKAAGAQAIISFVSTAALGTVLHGVNESGLDIPIADVHEQRLVRATRDVQSQHAERAPVRRAADLSTQPNCRSDRATFGARPWCKRVQGGRDSGGQFASLDLGRRSHHHCSSAAARPERYSRAASRCHRRYARLVPAGWGATTTRAVPQRGLAASSACHGTLGSRGVIVRRPCSRPRRSTDGEPLTRRPPVFYVEVCFAAHVSVASRASRMRRRRGSTRLRASGCVNA